VAGFGFVGVPGFGYTALCILIAVIGLEVAIELGLSIGYLASPAFMDHIEASVASNAHYFLAGLPLYPALDSYTFNGLLYGPLLAELNSLGSVLFGEALASKVIGWVAAWSAVALMVGSGWKSRTGSRGLVGAAYALCLLVSLGADLTLGRSEPLLLLLATTALFMAVHQSNPFGLATIGLLCGAAADLKLHGPAYLLAPLCLCIVRYWPRRTARHRLATLLLLAAAGVVGLVVPFLPSNVSAEQYVRYLTLALKHGLDLDLFGRNCVFMLGMWAPMILFFRGAVPAWGGGLGAGRLELLVFGAALLIAESAVIVVASKPGAGIHHLLPFLALHAYLFQRLYIAELDFGTGEDSADSKAALALLATILGMAWPTAQAYGQLFAFDRQRPQHVRMRDELQRMATRFPGGMIGVAGDSSYDLTNFRPWITRRGVPQTDYGAYMDLRLSGIDDAPLRSAFDRCAIPFIYMPKPGAPFSVNSKYGGALFSDALRADFARRYSAVAAESDFEVFACTTGPRG
jgi:hypothetical protein